MRTVQDLERNLEAFTGTENYYRHWTGEIVYTDGVRYLAEKAGAHWLIDAIASWQHRVKDCYFQIWELRVNDDGSAVLTMKEDTDEPEKVRQKIPFTDFPLEYIKLYCIDGVLLLPSEY